ncbi:hypothetical protein OSTOST_08358, partial [Ostertagia ostertagi]
MGRRTRQGIQSSPVAIIAAEPSGGRIVSAWPPVVAKNYDTWKKLADVWNLLDATLEKRAGSGQFFRTANSKIEDGKVFCELGVPEASLSYHGTDCTVACAKILYEAIKRKTADLIPLPELKRMEPQLLRTAASERGGMIGTVDGSKQGHRSREPDATRCSVGDETAVQICIRRRAFRQTGMMETESKAVGATIRTGQIRFQMAPPFREGVECIAHHRRIDQF